MKNLDLEIFDAKNLVLEQFKCTNLDFYKIDMLMTGFPLLCSEDPLGGDLGAQPSCMTGLACVV
jgi:hypothetical protein